MFTNHSLSLIIPVPERKLAAGSCLSSTGFNWLYCDETFGRQKLLLLKAASAKSGFITFQVLRVVERLCTTVFLKVPHTVD